MAAETDSEHLGVGEHGGRKSLSEDADDLAASGIEPYEPNLFFGRAGPDLSGVGSYAPDQTVRDRTLEAVPLKDRAAS